MLSGKDELPSASDNEFFIFAHLESLDQRPRFFVLPRNLVAALIYVDHRLWLKTPARNGQPQNHSDRRSVRIDDVRIYEDSWGLLEEPASDVFKAPVWFVEHWREFGLPLGHPGITIAEDELPHPADPKNLFPSAYKTSGGLVGRIQPPPPCDGCRVGAVPPRMEGGPLGDAAIELC
jgi:hypothetical protein